SFRQHPNFRLFSSPLRWFRVCGAVASGEANYGPVKRIWEGVCEKNFTDPCREFGSVRGRTLLAA
ncbi:hypothetical protein, partial [Xanthomonas campestris]|uniref:hypothetical protein n=1 Tax=Xanthomonas campestris TaxID=339 RepID=UPI003557690D